MDLSGPGIDVKLKERKKEERRPKEGYFMDDSIVLNRTEAYNLQTLLAFNISHLKCHL